MSNCLYCSIHRNGSTNGCKIHEGCDLGCMALKNPTTLEEYKKAFIHWKSHPVWSGCSHGC